MKINFLRIPEIFFQNSAFCRKITFSWEFHFFTEKIYFSLLAENTNFDCVFTLLFRCIFIQIQFFGEFHTFSLKSLFKLNIIISPKITFLLRNQKMSKCQKWQISDPKKRAATAMFQSSFRLFSIFSNFY